MSDADQHALAFFSLDDALREVLDRQRADHPRRYQPLDATRSAMVRAFFREQVLSEGWRLGGDPSGALVTLAGLRIATGYRRVVVGDYGAFIECTLDQIIEAALQRRPIPSGRPVESFKYLWLETCEPRPVKVYEQLATVRYADYVAGQFYVAPADVRAPVDRERRD